MTAATDSAYAERAREAAGNWMKFRDFGWHDQPDDAERWTIVYTHNRDSDLLAQSNAEAIAKELAPFIRRGTVREESHRHWARGWVDGYSILVYRKDGGITKAFHRWCDLQDALESYPVLDEEDLSSREYEATLENIEGEIHRANRDDNFQIPDDAASALYSWLSDNNSSAIECRDGGGGYPSVDDLQEAMTALGWKIYWKVRWNDCGARAEWFDTEPEADQRVQSLRAEGFYAFYDVDTPDAE